MMKKHIGHHTPVGVDRSRRDILKLSALGLAGAATLGIGGWRGASAQQPVELTFAFGPDDSGSLQALIDAFNSEHEGEIRVSYREMDRESDAYFRQLESNFQVGSDEIDVFGADIIWTAEFAYQGWVEDLSARFHNEYAPDDFLDAPLSSAGYRNRIWAVPWFTDAGMLYYRRDLLEAGGFDGAPKTWEELKEMGQKAAQDGGVEHGFVFQGGEYEGGVTNALEYIWSTGGRVLTGNVSVAGAFGMVVIDPNVIVIDSENSARGLDIARSMIADGLAPEDVVSFREQDAAEAFLQGNAVFMRNWPFVYGLIDTEQSQLSKDQVGVAAIPVAASRNQSYSCLGGWNLMISATSGKQEAAWEFIRFATSPGRQRARAKQGGFLPTLKALYDDAELLDQVPVMELATEAVDHARVRPVSPYYSDMSPRIASAFNRVLRGELSGAEAAERLQRELQTILRESR